VRFRRRSVHPGHLELLERENERLRAEVQGWETWAKGAARRELEAWEAVKLTAALNQPYLLPSEESPPCP
jgi:hypothetical protein